MSFEEGDRVTVAGLPGVVTYINGNGSLDIEFDDNDGYYTDYVPTSIVEKIVEPLKVGDSLTAAAVVRADFKPGTVVVGDGNGIAYLRTPDNWRRQYDDTEHMEHMGGSFTIVHLPEVAQF
jgi:hypothetical protein